MYLSGWRPVEEGIREMNPLLGYLGSTAFRYDPSAFTPMCRVFMNASTEQEGEFMAAARAMQYENFLHTVYWKIVCGWKISQPPYCRRCRARYALNVHHKNYEIHGEEHRHLDKLEVLCRDCHAAGHNVATPEQVIETLRRRSRFGVLLVKPSDKELAHAAREQILDLGGLRRI